MATENQLSSDKRKRGAQPGNHNALKHGFYARQFLSGELDDLESHQPESLQDEIAMLRVITRRVVALSNGVESLEEATHLLRALGLAATRLASLLKAQKAMGGEGDAMSDALGRALAELAQEMRTKNTIRRANE